MPVSFRVSEHSSLDHCDDFGLTYDLVTPGPKETSKSSSGASPYLDELASTIETSIIPRLLLSHGARPAMNDMSRQESMIVPANPGVEEFVEHLLAQDNGEAMALVNELVSRGQTVEDVILGLLSPAARHLGDLWTADLLSFVDVTLGLSRIQQMLRQIRVAYDPGTDPAYVKGKALLVPAPGEQHTFGLRVVEEFLLRDGWEVRSSLKAETDEILDLVAAEHYDIVGFSLSGERLLPALRSAIEGVRKASRHPAVRIMVGGVIFVEQPGVKTQIDADAVVFDAFEAVSKANEWYTPAQVN